MPLDSGKKIRTYNLLSPLAKKHQISYLCYADQRKEKLKIDEMEKIGFKVYSVPPSHKFDSFTKLAAGIFTGFFTKQPLVVRKHYSSRFQKKLIQLIAENNFDLIHCEWTHYGQFINKSIRLPKFLSSHNVEYIPWLRFFQYEKNIIKKCGLYIEWKKMKFFEKKTLSKFDHISVVSDNDLRLIKNWFGNKSIQVIPNGINCFYYSKIDPAPTEKTILFSASMDAFVNQDAARYFSGKILPKVKQKIPNIRFIILGRHPPENIKKLSSENIVVTGTVDDVRPFLKDSLVSVVPLRIAGGSRLKILEAFAAGIPVVSTTIGAEGLDVKNNIHLLVADNADNFAEAVIELICNYETRSKLIKNARQLVEEKYDWGKIYPAIEKAWETTISKFNRRKVCNSH